MAEDYDDDFDDDDDDDDDDYDDDFDDDEDEEVSEWYYTGKRSFHHCCAARVLDSPIEEILPDIASAKDKTAAWQAFMAEHKFGLLIYDKPYEDFEPLCDGLWYMVWETWVQTQGLTKMPEIPLRFPQLINCPLFGYGADHSKYNIISNFPYGLYSVEKNLEEVLEAQGKKWNFVMINEAQTVSSELILLKYNFKVISRFLNPFHDGTKITFYLREPSE